ncbi:MAG: dTDP-4-dehydrorhamnose 3,5-epimerase family protein [Deltaproteobacteria bacterium]|uniref:dTDP-4-dehydrorhamnose 3,5-epimerase family protein n=1 Tax=Candidatus Zymogenus saltonus TaxID=2844893 RepID=A0A9D8KBR9_9DELT|nr:dTDP-4-dehydrorhamnose 3,5-epimerase family protein [Candidatus Zymogenus saltonus]
MVTIRKIEGVKIKELKVIPDERGRLMEILRSDDEIFEKFGQVYLTAAYPGVVKAWHYHKLQTDHMTVVKGMMKVVLFDDREGSKTKGEVMEIFMGEHNQLLVKIPPGVYHGFKCISETEAVVINVPTEVYNREEPDEYRLPAHDNNIPYDWGRVDR